MAKLQRLLEYDNYITESKDRPNKKHKFFGNSIAIEFFSDAKRTDFFTKDRMDMAVTDIKRATKRLNFAMDEKNFSFNFIKNSYYDLDEFTKVFFIKVFGIKGNPILEGEILSIIYDELKIDESNGVYVNTPPIVNADAFLVNSEMYRKDYNDKNLITKID